MKGNGGTIVQTGLRGRKVAVTARERGHKRAKERDRESENGRKKHTEGKRETVRLKGWRGLIKVVS